jgi:hypothetical protein
MLEHDITINIMKTTTINMYDVYTQLFYQTPCADYCIYLLHCMVYSACLNNQGLQLQLEICELKYRQ